MPIVAANDSTKGIEILVREKMGRWSPAGSWWVVGRRPWHKRRQGKAASAVQPSAVTRLQSRSAAVGPILTKVAQVKATSGSQVSEPGEKAPGIFLR